MFLLLIIGISIGTKNPISFGPYFIVYWSRFMQCLVIPYILVLVSVGLQDKKIPTCEPLMT